jgi:hypothetical protein
MNANNAGPAAVTVPGRALPSSMKSFRGHSYPFWSGSAAKIGGASTS